MEEKQIIPHSVLRRKRHPHACSDNKILIPAANSLINPVYQKLYVILVFHKNQEFIASDAGTDIICTHAVAHLYRHFLQHPITELMPVLVIRIFKIIQISNANFLFSALLSFSASSMALQA